MTLRLDVLPAADWADRVAADLAARLRDEPGTRLCLVTGERKASILARALEAPEGPDCPATWLRRHPTLRVIADDAAAAGLRGHG